MQNVVVFIDGGCRSNPGEGAWGVDICFEEHNRTSLSGFLSYCTNNQAEYKALDEACSFLVAFSFKKDTQINIYSDSKLVVNQVNGLWKVNEAVLPYYKKAKKSFDALQKITSPVKLQWVPREENTKADSLCNDVMDAHGVVSNRKKSKQLNS